MENEDNVEQVTEDRDLKQLVSIYKFIKTCITGFVYVFNKFTTPLTLLLMSAVVLYTSRGNVLTECEYNHVGSMLSVLMMVIFVRCTINTLVDFESRKHK